MRYLATFFVLTITLNLSSAHAASLQNGSFEQGVFAPPQQDTQTLGVGSDTITGWTVSADLVAWIGASNPWQLYASDGSKYLDLTDYQLTAPFGGIEQSVMTEVGKTYELSFDLGSSLSYGLPTALIASADATSQEFVAQNTTENDFWETFSLIFTATDTSTLVSFVGSQGSGYIGLDNVTLNQVAAVPLPAGWILLLAGVAVPLGLRRSGALS
ncbi:MAG: DUF642 domain-containing protein [Pseudomonadota bacterium]